MGAVEQPDFQSSLQAEVDRQTRFIMANREALVKAWVAETGLLPSESEIIERRLADGGLSISIRKLERVEIR